MPLNCTQLLWNSFDYQLQAVRPFADRFQNLVKCRFFAVVESRALGEGLCIPLPGRGIGQDKGLVLGDVGLVVLTETFRLMRRIGVHAD